MDRASVIEKLREHERELRDAGIVRMSLFGSVARGDATSRSDIDLMVDFDDAKRVSLIRVIGIKHRLEDILGAEVDLAQTKMLKAGVRESALREAVLAF